MATGGFVVLFVHNLTEHVILFHVSLILAKNKVNPVTQSLRDILVFERFSILPNEVEVI